jgi:pre-mRNA-splicing factor SYF1
LLSWLSLTVVQENIGTFETTKAVYEKIVDLRIATPQIIINFAHFLEENKFYEEAFKTYEKGLEINR